jgi:hypothetical protein
MDYYKLDDKNNAILCTENEWKKINRNKKEKLRNQVAFDFCQNYKVTTVFLGLDYSYILDSKPMLFETMISGEGRCSGYQTRCTTWKEAEELHQKVIQWIKDGCQED